MRHPSSGLPETSNKRAACTEQRDIGGCYCEQVLPVIGA
jgi:hypothetical protein